ncbi:MAG: right-handed parallel beta-helix repeat-containing protein [Candidatus Sulfobium sp.]
MKRKRQYRPLAILAVSVLILTAFGPASAATITVSNTNDSGAGSLRQAVIDAASGDTINFAVTGTIVLTSGDIYIDKELTIAGPGAASLAISGNQSSSVFNTALTGTVRISGITLRDAVNAISNGSDLVLNNVVIENNSGSIGSGINSCFNGSTLTVTNSTFVGNSADHGGGAIATCGNTTITGSTFSGNQAKIDSSGYGGAIALANTGTYQITNSTFYDNSADQGGAIIANYDGLTITNCTFSGNHAARGGSALYIADGIVVNAVNSIFADGTDSSNCNAGITGTNSHNLDFGGPAPDNSCNAAITGDPRLGGLADNGGPTQTMAPQPGSAAIDLADPNDFPSTDQRGISRPQGAGPDIGAYEYVAAAQTLPVSLALNKSSYAVGGPLNVDVTIANPGSQLTADVYFAILLPASSGPSFGCPQGDALLFFSNGMTGASVVCASDPVQNFPRAFEGLTIPAGLPTTTVKNFLSIVWPQGAPAGGYQVFAIFTRSGALMDGTVDAGDIVGMATATFSFSP